MILNNLNHEFYNILDLQLQTKRTFLEVKKGGEEIECYIFYFVFGKKSRNKEGKKMERKKSLFTRILAFAIMLFWGNLSLAVDFPTKPIEWLAPYGPGAPSALSLKIVMDTASKYLGQPVLMIGAAGAGGTIASSRVARAKPDGYTLLQVTSGNNGSALYTKKDLAYTNDDFEFLAQYGGFDIALFVKADSEFKTLEDFIEYAKKNPNTIKVCTQGVGTGQHLTLELLKLKGGGLKIDMVVFKTTFEMRTNVLGGHVHGSFIFGGAGGSNDEFRRCLDGGGRLLAVASKKRLEAYPDLPTFSEKGLDIFYSAWYGIGGPKGMPPEVSQKLKNAIYKAIEEPEVVKAIKNMGFKYEFLKSEEFTGKAKEFGEIIKNVVEEAKIPRM